MATIHGAPGGSRLVAVKGSPLEVLALCTHELERGSPQEITPERRAAIAEANAAMAAQAMRVLGFAYREDADAGREPAARI